MTRYDVIVVGAGVAGSLVAHRLGGRGRRVLVLEAGAAGHGAHEPPADPLSTYLTAAAKVPGSPYRADPAAPWPEVTDLSGTPGTRRFPRGRPSAAERPAPVRQRLRPRQRRHRQRLDRPRAPHAPGGLRHRVLRIWAAVAAHVRRS
ncbi:hypothetical protein RB200_05635 [Streptomyces sp. PmtG]